MKHKDIKIPLDIILKELRKLKVSVPDRYGWHAYYVPLNNVEIKSFKNRLLQRLD